MAAAEKLASDRLCILFIRHAHLLRVLCTPQIFCLDGQVDGIPRQLPLVSRNPALHTTRHHRDDLDIKRLQLHPQRVAVRVQGGFGAVVHAAKHIRHYTRQTANLQDRAFGLYEQRRECLTHAHHAKHIDLVGEAHLLEINVRGRHRVIPARVVDEVVELSSRTGRDFFF